MRRQIPTTIEEIDETKVREFARDADERSFRTEHGQFTIRRVEKEGLDHWWPVRPANGIPYRITADAGQSLGDLTTVDLERSFGDDPRRHVA